MGMCVAIVGARNCTPYGFDLARSLAADLAAQGLCIVSGLARGIDAAAHEGALSVRGRTIAVLAGGVDVPYPSSSRRLYDRIAQQGALVSEQDLGYKPRDYDFPKRNRIIAGLSRAIVVVQGVHEGDGGRKSGAIGTANRGNEFGRDVFAVPGDVHSILSSGPHHLLREGNARVCTRAGDVLDELFGRGARRVPQPDASWDRLVQGERIVMEAVAEIPSRSDGIADRTGMDAAQTNRLLTRLELLGLIHRDAAGYYRRV